MLLAMTPLRTTQGACPSSFQEWARSGRFPRDRDWKGGAAFLLFGLCAGLLMRLFMLWFIDVRFDAGDAVGYVATARNLLDHGIFSDALTSPQPYWYRPPLYSFFVALVFAVSDRSLPALQLAQVIMSLVTGVLVTRVVGRWYTNAAPGVFLLAMLLPFDAAYATVALSETLAAFLVAAAVYSFFVLEGGRRWVWGGIFLGLLSLTKDIYLPLILVSAAAVVCARPGEGKRSRYVNAGILVACALLVISPWTIRNFLVADRFVPVSQGRLAFSVWMGTWATNADFTRSDGSGQRAYPAEAYRNAAERDLMNDALLKFSTGQTQAAESVFRGLALERIASEPLAVLGRYVIRQPKLWLGTRFDLFQLNERMFPRDSTAWRAAKSLLWGLNLAIVLLAFLGIVSVFCKRNVLRLLVVPIAYTALVYLPLNSFENRYSQPVYPLLIACAGIALAWIASHRGAAERRVRGDRA